MEYNLNGIVSFDDYVQFNKTHRKRGFYKIIGIINWFFYLALIILIALLALVLILGPESPLDFIKNNSAAMALLACGSSLILFNTIGMRLIYKKHYDANKLLQQTQNIKINEQSISIISESGAINLTKEDTNKIIYDKDSIYVYIGVKMAHVFKKRFLENENDFEELVKFLKSHYEK